MRGYSFSTWRQVIARWKPNEWKESKGRHKAFVEYNNWIAVHVVKVILCVPTSGFWSGKVFVCIQRSCIRRTSRHRHWNAFLDHPLSLISRPVTQQSIPITICMFPAISWRLWIKDHMRDLLLGFFLFWLKPTLALLLWKHIGGTGLVPQFSFVFQALIAFIELATLKLNTCEIRLQRYVVPKLRTPSCSYPISSRKNKPSLARFEYDVLFAQPQIHTTPLHGMYARLLIKFWACVHSSNYTFIINRRIQADWAFHSDSRA